ncbi:MAG: hypothetical protein ACT4TC_09600 [Myxococcaceae bacterium]
MSHRSLAALPLFLAALVLSARCGGAKNDGTGGGSQNMGDGGTLSDGGSGGPVTCTNVPTWNGVDPVATYVANQTFPYNIALSFVDFPTSYSLIQMEDYHASNTYPKTANFTTADKYFTCDTCVTLWDGCVDANGTTTGQGVFYSSPVPPPSPRRRRARTPDVSPPTCRTSSWWSGCSRSWMEAGTSPSRTAAATTSAPHRST